MKLYNENCIDRLKKIEDESIDLVCTDPPYRIVSGGCTKHMKNGLIKSGMGTNGMIKVREPSGILNRRYKRATRGSKHISLCGILNDLDATTYTRQGKLFKHNDIKFSEWLPDVYRVLKKGTHCYIMINARNLNELINEALKVGFVFQQLLVWKKNNATPNRYYLNQLEFILMLSKRPARDINKMGTSNILEFDNIIGNKLHPTQKNTEMLKVLIENSTNKGDVVLDPFMGVGTTGVASRGLERDFIGIELDEKYYSIAKEVLENNKTYDDLREEKGMNKTKIKQVETQPTIFDYMESKLNV